MNEPNLIPISRFRSEDNEWPTHAGLRYIIDQMTACKPDFYDKYGDFHRAVIRLGKRWFINKQEFILWEKARREHSESYR